MGAPQQRVGGLDTLLVNLAREVEFHLLIRWGWTELADFSTGVRVNAITCLFSGREHVAV